LKNKNAFSVDSLQAGFRGEGEWKLPSIAEHSEKLSPNMMMPTLQTPMSLKSKTSLKFMKGKNRLSTFNKARNTLKISQMSSSSDSDNEK
jgi:hypothetical protein